MIKSYLTNSKWSIKNLIWNLMHQGHMCDEMWWIAQYYFTAVCCNICLNRFKLCAIQINQKCWQCLRCSITPFGNQLSLIILANWNSIQVSPLSSLSQLNPIRGNDFPWIEEKKTFDDSVESINKCVYDQHQLSWRSLFLEPGDGTIRYPFI